MKTLILVFAAMVLLMGQDKPTPISPEYITLGNALGIQQQQLNEAQAKITAAAKLLEDQICQQAKIEHDACVVDWQAGTVGQKPAEKTSEKK